MGQIMAVISGKGGTGKTTVCAAVATCLAARGQRVLCIDADIGLRNLDIALGMSEQLILPFTDVCEGRSTLADATQHPMIENLFLLTAPILQGEDAVSLEKFKKLLSEAKKQFDWCLIDSAAGLGLGFQLATSFANLALVVSTPDPAALRDAARVVEILQLSRPMETYLVVNRVKRKMFSRMRMTVDDMMDSIGLPLIGLLPEDKNVVLSAVQDTALILKTDRGASVACMRIADRLCGNRIGLMLR